MQISKRAVAPEGAGGGAGPAPEPTVTSGKYNAGWIPTRPTRKRQEIQKSIRDTTATRIVAEGSIWACCFSSECKFAEFCDGYKRGIIDSTKLSITTAYTEVIFCEAFRKKTVFLFRFGCVVGWDLDVVERVKILNILRPFQSLPEMVKYEDDEMSYVWATEPAIKQDTIHLVSGSPFEKLSYAYAFAQCVKLSHFEANVDDTIERTRSIPESLANTGKINASREDISKRIGELFTSRFYINLHTDILDTPDIFWEYDEFCDHYQACRSYLEIPKRVDILNQRLDIIKDLYDMLNAELSIEHGHRLEWIVIYLICVEVLIEVVWGIVIKDILHLV